MDTLLERHRDKVLDSFATKFTVGDGCWEWTAAFGKDGYGQWSLYDPVGKKQKHYKPHRVMYELMVGPIPDGLTLDHLCRNRACIRPGHCEPVDHRTNILRGQGLAAVNAAKTHCIHGHEFTEANTYRYGPDGRYRMCKACW